MTAAAQPASVNQNKTPQTARRDQLVTENISLVKAIASHIQRSLPVHVELDDLVHAGTMGLLSAATKFLDDKEVSFPTYAKHRIRGAILDSLRDADTASRETRKRYKQKEAVTHKLTSKLGRTPTDTEVASAMNLDPKRWQTLMLEFRSLTAAASQYKDSDREDNPLDEAKAPLSECPENTFARTQMREKLGLAMRDLPERYQEVVKLYYERDMSMKVIGSYLGVNESRVSQIHKSALMKMNVFFGTVGVQSAAAFRA
jgi:RNA polymerase sigma factor for flagellar operon FliA